MECEFATINSNKDEILKIFNETKTIAIVGLSPNIQKASYKVAKYLQEAGFKIVPIYPKEEIILGEKVYRSLNEIPFDIDLVDIFRKPEAIAKVVDEVLQIKDERDIKTVWFQLELVNNEAALKAKNAGLNVVQNRCTAIEHQALFS